MPFTPSHAVVALPFVRTPLLPAAVAIGAMTPDLPLFLRGTPLTYQATHTNLLLSAAVALVLVVLWYGLLRPAVRELAPAAAARRLPAAWDAPAPVPAAWWRRRPAPASALLLLVSVLVGVVSHVVWDAFTHEARWGVRLLPQLEAPWGPLPGYKWLQHGSSALGLAILAAYALWWLSRRAPHERLDRVLPGWVRPVWWAALPAILVGAWLIGLGVHGPFTAQWTPQHLAYRVLPPACAVWAALTVAVCAWVGIARVRRRPTRAQDLESG